MVLTLSLMKPLGSSALDFELLDPGSGSMQSLDELRGNQATVILFLCNHCPYVVHIHDALQLLARDLMSGDIAFIGINSNDPIAYPQDAPERMPEQNYPFVYLFDETQEVARAYGAECTPDIFVYDADLKLIYRGQFDETRPGSGKQATGGDLREALRLASQGSILDPQYPSSGCNIKWR